MLKLMNLCNKIVKYVFKFIVVTFVEKNQFQVKNYELKFFV